MLQCPFCGNNNLIEESLRNRLYYQCFETNNTGCGGFFMKPEHFAKEEEQKNRYLLHTNELCSQSESNGYRKYLEKFLANVFKYEEEKEKCGNVKALFDYGSGPSPALVMLLKEKNQKSVFLNDVQIKHWDPFFYPEGDFFENGADIVFCLEVIEHFENPIEGFKGLAKATAKNGLIAIQTQIAPKTFKEFKKWWYKDDFTHVSFYTLSSMENCVQATGLTFETYIDGVVFLRKI